MPFFVSATAGTTVYGAFDPLMAIADICKKHDVWMHVDVSRSASLNLRELTDSGLGSKSDLSVGTSISKYHSLDAELRTFSIERHYRF